jgi:hypothetical protein
MLLVGVQNKVVSSTLLLVNPYLARQFLPAKDSTKTTSYRLPSTFEMDNASFIWTMLLDSSTFS